MVNGWRQRKIWGDNGGRKMSENAAIKCGEWREDSWRHGDNKMAGCGELPRVLL